MLSGIPMLLLTWPVMAAALFPVIALETWIFERRLHFGPKRLSWRVGVANAVSMVVGVPLLWIIWVGLEALVPRKLLGVLPFPEIF